VLVVTVTLERGYTILHFEHESNPVVLWLGIEIWMLVTAIVLAAGSIYWIGYTKTRLEKQIGLILICVLILLHVAAITTNVLVVNGLIG